MGHRCCGKHKVKRGLWSPEEDEKLIRHVTTNGHGSWSSVPKHAGLQRCGKSCRLRWINYLRPELKRGSFTEEEEQIIIDVHRILGNRWAQIAKHLPGRTDNEVKNFWNSCIKKKLMSQGLDPQTHNLISSHKRSAANIVAGGNAKSQSHIDQKTPIFTMNNYPQMGDSSTEINYSSPISAPILTLPINAQYPISQTIFTPHTTDNQYLDHHKNPNSGYWTSVKDPTFIDSTVNNISSSSSTSSMFGIFDNSNCAWAAGAELYDAETRPIEVQAEAERSDGQAVELQMQQAENEKLLEMKMKAIDQDMDNIAAPFDLCSNFDFNLTEYYSTLFMSHDHLNPVPDFTWDY